MEVNRSDHVLFDRFLARFVVPAHGSIGRSVDQQAHLLDLLHRSICPLRGRSIGPSAGYSKVGGVSIPTKLKSQYAIFYES